MSCSKWLAVSSFNEKGVITDITCEYLKPVISKVNTRSEEEADCLDEFLPEPTLKGFSRAQDT